MILTEEQQMEGQPLAQILIEELLEHVLIRQEIELEQPTQEPDLLRQGLIHRERDQTLALHVLDQLE